MKKLLFLLLVFMIFSCRNAETITQEKPMPKDPYEKFYGNWVGDFNFV